jgi:hypothetical protein
MSNLTEKE